MASKLWTVNTDFVMKSKIVSFQVEVKIWGTLIKDLPPQW